MMCVMPAPQLKSLVIVSGDHYLSNFTRGMPTHQFRGGNQLTFSSRSKALCTISIYNAHYLFGTSYVSRTDQSMPELAVCSLLLQRQ